MCCSCRLQGAKDTDQLLTLVVGNQTFLSDPTAADRRPVELLVARVRAGLLPWQHRVCNALAAPFLLHPDCWPKFDWSRLQEVHPSPTWRVAAVTQVGMQPALCANM